MQNIHQTIDEICAWLARECEGFGGYVLGLSGGLDSAVVAALCARAGLRTEALIMPLAAQLGSADFADAKALAQQLGINAQVVVIDSAVNAAAALCGVSSPFAAADADAATANSSGRPQKTEASGGVTTTHQSPSKLVSATLSRGEFAGCEEKSRVDRPLEVIERDFSDAPAKSSARASGNRFGNLCARTRMMILYDFSAANDLLVAGTSNRSERELGYFTLHGDGACALNPIANFYKTQIRQIAAALGIPAHLIAKKPSANLLPGQCDESDLGADYEQIDEVLCALAAGQPVDEKWQYLAKMRAQNAFKLRPARVFTPAGW